MTVPADRSEINTSGGAWCIYVGKAAKGNFVIGRGAGTWGFDKFNKLQAVKRGDRLIFVESLDGFGRLSADQFLRTVGRAKTVVEAVVTSDIYEDPESLWPDGPYPYRFKFVEVGQVENAQLTEIAPPAVIEAIRLSGLKQGSAIFAGGSSLAETPRPEHEESTVGSLEGLANATYMDLADLQEIESLLIQKRQVVLEGPPGSGKTYLADKFARYFTNNRLDGPVDDAVEIVQFHQSYGYEDFVQGIRPTTNLAGSLHYEVTPGIFLEFCTRAEMNPTKRYVIIIDEINRGNISRIFGELLLLLEYREKRVRLPYGTTSGTDRDYLSIPLNVFIIGTMNSTDRSLALIDYALRRRFYFYRLLPTINHHAPVFARWLAQQDLLEVDQIRLVSLFIRLNERIQEYLPQDFQIGHSYFMVNGIGDYANLELIWKHAVMPLLTEYFHSSRNAEEILGNFTIESLSESITPELETGTTSG